MQPLLLVGAAGTLEHAFLRATRLRSLAVVPLTRRDLDIADEGSVAAAIDRWRPWAVINAAGYVRVDDAERDPEACWQSNTAGATRLARACAATGVQFLTFSSDLVFDGQRTHPYVESDAVAPLSTYGRSKAAAERAVLDNGGGALLVRTSSFFGPWDHHNFATRLVRELQSGHRVPVAADVTMTATYLPGLVHASLDLLIDAESGVWHIANPGPVTWEDFARLICRASGISECGIAPVAAADMGWTAARPQYSALGTERGELLLPLPDAVAQWSHDRMT